MDLTKAEKADLEIELREMVLRELSTLHFSHEGLEAGSGSRDLVIKTDAKYTSHQSSVPRFWTSEVGTWPRALLDGGRLEHDHNQSLPQVTSRAPARPYALAESWPVAASMLQVPAACRHLERRPSRPSSTSVIRRPFLMPRLAMDSAGAVLITEPQFPTSDFQTCSLTDLGKLTLHFQTANSRLPASIGAERGLG